eukprot:TRINITY_DN80207_c0_g1_i1.p1 TRINITY_DN80207_c0_g1~~TRINITY_DN80207_c0_g1_i1.p1  ORF type:complete len:449 (-),score=31.80 TRINITY_DN80207_c0_g1_i1:19-1311(-)
MSYITVPVAAHKSLLPFRCIFFLSMVVLVASRGNRREPDDPCTKQGELHARICWAWNLRSDSKDGLPTVQAATKYFGKGAQLRHLGGSTSMIAQNTPHRAQKRKLSLGPELITTKQAFQPDAFHFGKVKDQEVLLCFDPWREIASAACEGDADCLNEAPKAYAWDPGAKACGVNATAPVAVIINVQPVCHMHMLVVPRIQGQHSQVLTRDAIDLGLAFAAFGSSRLRLSFNSIGAGASVNHLHWQGFFSAPDPSVPFPFDEHVRNGGGVEAAAPKDGVSLYVARDWPITAWIFTLEDNSQELIERTSFKPSPAVRLLGAAVHAFVAALQSLDMAHNVIVSHGARRVAIFPRRILSTHSVDTSLLQVAGHEVLGWWISNREEDFKALDEASGVATLKTAALSAEQHLLVTDALTRIGWKLHSVSTLSKAEL